MEQVLEKYLSIFSPEELFVMEKTVSIFQMISDDYSSLFLTKQLGNPFHIPKSEWYSSWKHIPWKFEVLPTATKQFFTLKVVHAQPPTFYQNYHLSLSTSLWLQDLFQLPVFSYVSLDTRVSRFWLWQFACILSSLIQEKPLIFTLSSFFLL